MAAHAPFIMPDGRSLIHYLAQEREREQLRRRKAELRGKDLQFAQLVHQRGAAMSDLELAELKAMENAGVRRRRRWLNDKTLRDLAGPLSATGMEAQFKPAPFGVAVPSPLAQAMAPANAALWDNFRNIDPEKEARVLQKWATHQRDSAPLRPRSRTAASLALQRWAAVGRKARTALKRANPSSVLQLELQILDFFERSGPAEQLFMAQDDGFARLLVHGLAEFYGLLSASRTDPASGATGVAVYRRTKPISTSVGVGTGGQHIDISLALEVGASGTTARQGGSATRCGGGGASSTGPSLARGSVAGASPARSDSGACQPPATPTSASIHTPTTATSTTVVTSTPVATENCLLASTTATATTPVGATPVAAAPAGPDATRGPSPSPSTGRKSSVLPGGRTGPSPSPSPVPGARPASATRTASAGREAGSRGHGDRSGGGDASGVVQEAEPDITCTDILLAMLEVGQMGLNEEVLRRYVAVHIHGTAAVEGHMGGGGGQRRGEGQGQDRQKVCMGLGRR